MTAAVRYHTRSGNTKKLADAIAKEIHEDSLPVSSPLTADVDVLFLGASVYAGAADGEGLDFIRENSAHIGRIVVFGTSAMKKTARASVEKAAAECGVPVAEAEFSCRGSFLVLHRGHPDQSDLDAAAEFASKFIQA